MDDQDFYGRQFGQKIDSNIKESIVEIHELNNFKEDETYIILNHENEFKTAKLSKIVIIPESNTGKKKYPKTAQFKFNQNEFILNKYFNGNIDDWRDMGGELFSKYRIFRIINNDNIIENLSKLIKNKAIENKDFKIINEIIPNIKFKDKYIKYKLKYTNLKKLYNL